MKKDRRIEDANNVDEFEDVERETFKHVKQFDQFCTYHSQNQLNSTIELMTKIVRFRFKRKNIDHLDIIDDNDTLNI